jgi:sugar/nucleoside kinase (ribokinase family)
MVDCSRLLWLLFSVPPPLYCRPQGISIEDGFMAATVYDVVGIGNAIVDVLSHADDTFLENNKLFKGTMTLADSAESDALYQAMGPGVEMSGGSAANTIAGLASLGGAAAFIGKTRNDQLGRIFRHDIESLGVAFPSTASEDGPPTGRCLVLVTPDAQRTMQTCLGANTTLSPADIDKETISAASVTYLEGYLWDQPPAKEAFIKAARLAHEAGGRVALSLSDPFCVDRHRDDFLELVENHVDVVFANEDEIVSLYQVHAFDDAVARVRNHCQIAALTRSEKGSVIVTDEAVLTVGADPVEAVVDTTGAGDGFAAGFLYGLTRDLRLETCAQIGSVVAGEIISHVGARPDVSLSDVLDRKLG